MAKVTVLYRNYPASEIVGVYSSRPEAAFAAQKYEDKELTWTSRVGSSAIESGLWVAADMPLLDAENNEVDRLINFY